MNLQAPRPCTLWWPPFGGCRTKRHVITPGAVFPEHHAVQSNKVMVNTVVNKEDTINHHGLDLFKHHIV